MANANIPLAQQLQEGRFLVIGRVGMDLTPTPENTPTQHADSMMVSMGGSSANIAAGLVKLGCKASLVTCVSDDAIGWYCENQLDHYGVDRQYVRRVTGEARTSLAIYETRIENHQSVIYRNQAADFQLNETDIATIDFQQFSAVIATGTVFAAEPSRSAVLAAFKRAAALDLPIVFDIDYRPYSWTCAEEAIEVLSLAASQADLIVGNEDEFSFMTGGIEEGLQSAQSMAQASAKIAIYKRGEKGAFTYWNRDHHSALINKTADVTSASTLSATNQNLPAGVNCLETGVFPAKAIKPTGAGDSFLSGFLTSLAQGYSLKDAILRGSACAAIVVSKPGCAIAMPSQSELVQFIKENDPCI